MLSIYTGEEVVVISCPTCPCAYCTAIAYEILPDKTPMCGIAGNHQEMELGSKTNVVAA